MTTEIIEYVNVRERATELGCAIPEKIAILPVNFTSASTRSDLMQRSETATVRTLFRINAVPFDELLPKEERTPYVQNNSFAWIAPALFISTSVWSENPMAVSLALNVLAGYITDFFKGTVGVNKAKLEFIVERKGDYSCKKLEYEGDVSGIPQLADIIEKIANE